MQRMELLYYNPIQKGDTSLFTSHRFQTKDSNIRSIVKKTHIAEHYPYKVKGLKQIRMILMYFHRWAKRSSQSIYICKLRNSSK